MSAVKSKQRKSREASRSKSSSKQQKRTIDSFFSPQVLLETKAGEEDMRKTAPLNAEQSEILRQILAGQSMFFTGSAGTGKSLVLRAVIRALRRKFKTADAVAVTASTGMAASNIGGMTIHAWGAVSPTLGDLDYQIRCIRKCKPALQRWQQAQVLIIDEVSMVDGPLFTRICQIAQRLRQTDRPVGGIQLVVTGDFFQLPPVSRNPVFAFECDEWKRCIQRTLTLSQVFRQKDDTFVALLNELRLGHITRAACDTFRQLSRPLPPDPSGLLPTELFPRRDDVDGANSARLRALPGNERSFISRDSGNAPLEAREKLLKSMMAPPRLQLKVGAQVMLIKNLDERLVNGSIGKVIGFWSQGEVQGDVGKLSKSHIRNIELQADKITPVPRNYSTAEDRTVGSPSAKKGDKGKEKSKSTFRDVAQYPLVQFPVLDESTTEAVLLVYDEFRIENPDGTAAARRMQVPLILAWAISIHKSQGQTINLVKIDLGKVFEKGQSYVALSRAASLSGLQVIKFDPKKVKAHPKVIKWNMSLQSHIGVGSGSAPTVAPTMKKVA